MIAITKKTVYGKRLDGSTCGGQWVFSNTCFVNLYREGEGG
ncbi:hypothetical protein NSP_53290 [Nodularia spumigena CCY9414]|nr:hypothetical protein NSP_53290 [Nodularia spumigena CCY9414]